MRIERNLIPNFPPTVQIGSAPLRARAGKRHHPLAVTPWGVGKQRLAPEFLRFAARAPPPRPRPERGAGGGRAGARGKGAA